MNGGSIRLSRVLLELHLYGLATAVGATVLCFVVRMAGVHFGVDAPMPRSAGDPDDG